MRVGVLTGGGDCPGLNAVIRAVVRKGVKEYGYEFLGFRDGWKGPREGLTIPLDIKSTRGLLPRGGTILGSSRTNPFAIDGGVEKIKSNLAAAGVDALVAIGGEDTLGVATKLHTLGVNVIGVPKTIDNDLNATDYTFGFDTAVNIAMEAIDRLHTTAESHHRTLIVEVMGRHAGWIALHSGLAGGASCILIPEVPFSIEKVCEYVESRYKYNYAPIIVVAEGALPQGEHRDKRWLARCFWPRETLWYRRMVSKRDRESNWKRGSSIGPWPHSARWHSHCIRSGACHSLWPPCNHRGPRWRLGKDGGATGDQYRARPARDSDREVEIS